MLYLILGFLLWTLVEYLFHRFILHRKFVGKLKSLQFYYHGLHHLYPKDTAKLPIVYYLLIIASALMLFPLQLAIGFIVGFLGYEHLHYALHHHNYKNWIFRFLKQHHYHHHFKNTCSNYAVTLPLWDYVFLTL